MLNWLKSLAGGKRRNRRPEPAESQQPAPPRRESHQTAVAAGKSPVDHRRFLRDATLVPRSEHGISRKQIDEHALKVLYRLHKAGYQACLVGGAVRDLLLGKTPKDFDVATDATPEEVRQLFRNCRLIGRRFRLAHVHFGRVIIEVATYRADHGQSQSGRQDDSGKILRDNVYGNISDDVWRRDFTANALYYDISSFSIIDFVDGMSDIQQRRLSMIGDATVRYREDPVRMLRAIRFAAKLDFTIEDDSRQPILALGHLLDGIAPARLYEEALKLFHSGHAEKSFQALIEFDLLQYLFPATAVAIEQDANFRQLLQLAMQNTDERIRNDLRVTPAFLFAALLWQPISARANEIADKGMPYSVAIQKAATFMLGQQVRHISIPRRFTTVMRDIWGLQTRFHYRKGKRAQAVLSHPKFRAAYDFLCLRAKVGDATEEECQWWTDFQQQHPVSAGQPDDEAKTASSRRPGARGQGRRRRRPPRRRSKKTADS